MMNLCGNLKEQERVFLRNLMLKRIGNVSTRDEECGSCGLLASVHGTLWVFTTRDLDQNSAVRQKM